MQIKEECMDQVKTQIKKSIEDADQFQWKDCSYESPNGLIFGKEPSAAWQTWASRIKTILNTAVKSDSEPYIYFSEAENTEIKKK